MRLLTWEIHRRPQFLLRLIALCEMAVFSADNDLGSAVFYVVAGLGWLVVAMPLVKWMARPNPAPPSPPPEGDRQQTP